MSDHCPVIVLILNGTCEAFEITREKTPQFLCSENKVQDLDTTDFSYSRSREYTGGGSD